MGFPIFVTANIRVGKIPHPIMWDLERNGINGERNGINELHDV
jgi:hypothetical protein